MKKGIVIILVALAAVMPVHSQKAQVWMVGPMVHFNFSDKKMHTSFGIELAYWNYEKFPYSFDAGFEFQKGKFRLYSEAQTGIGLLGLSAGPVLEYSRELQKFNLGFQGSGWANYFGGVDLRFRRVAGVSAFSPGVYFKLPLGIGDSDGDFDDWDWDD